MRGISLVKVVGVALALVAALVGSSLALNVPGFSRHQSVKAVNGAVTIQLKDVADGKARFYRFAENGKEIRFFVVKGGDGTLKTAFDACDVCYKEKKGYEQSGNKMLCRNCKQTFATDRIGPHAVGGCNPSYLPSSQAGGKLVITLDDLRAGARFF
jgi:uncharacterized membrane protein